MEIHLHTHTVRVFAVAGRMLPFHKQPGRFVGRKSPARIVNGAFIFDAIDEGEVVHIGNDPQSLPWDYLHRALAHGDIEVAEAVHHERMETAPGPKKPAPVAAVVIAPADLLPPPPVAVHTDSE